MHSCLRPSVHADDALRVLECGDSQWRGQRRAVAGLRLQSCSRPRHCQRCPLAAFEYDDGLADRRSSEAYHPRSVPSRQRGQVSAEKTTKGREGVDPKPSVPGQSTTPSWTTDTHAHKQVVDWFVGGQWRWPQRRPRRRASDKTRRAAEISERWSRCRVVCARAKAQNAGTGVRRQGATTSILITLRGQSLGCGSRAYSTQ